MQPYDPLSTLHRGVEWLGSLPGFRGLRQQAFERHFYQHEGSNLYYGKYVDFAAAQASIPASVPQGYDHEAAALLYKERTKRVYPSDYPALYWLQRELGPDLRRVVDIGGHIGVAFYAYQRFLSFPPNLTWTVQEVPAVVAEGRRFAAEQGVDPRLRFTTAFEAASGADLLFASGSLQYLPDSLATKVARLAQRPRLLLLNLLPLHPTQSFYTVQSFGTAVSPYRIDSFQSFVDGLTDLGYQMADLWQNAEKSCEVRFEPELSIQHYHGMLFRLVA